MRARLGKVALVLAFFSSTAAAYDDGARKSARLLRVFSGHSNEVLQTALFRDGLRFLSCSGDHTLRLWKLDKDASISRWGSPGSVNGLSLSPDESKAASGGDEGPVRIWDARSGKPLTVFPGHKGAVNAVAFLPDGRTVLSAGTDKTIRLWDLRRERSNVVWFGHTGGVLALAVADDGRRVYSAGFDGTLRAWDVAEGTAVAVWNTGLDAVRSIVLSRDGRSALLVGGDRLVHAWDTDLGRESAAWPGHEARVLSAAFSEDGRHALTGDETGVVRYWDAVSGETLAAWQAHRDAVFTVEFSSDGRRALTGGWDTTVKLWELSFGGETAAAPRPEHLEADVHAMLVRLTRSAPARAIGPPDGDLPAEIALGRLLFFDPRLSKSGTMSCATCHQPERAFSDGRARPLDVAGQTLPRRTPSLLNIGHYKYNRFFWDGRAVSVEDAVQQVLRNPREFDRAPDTLIAALDVVPQYRRQLRELHGEAVRFEDAAHDIAAFVRSLTPPDDSAFDRFRLGGAPLEPAALKGFMLFGGKARCMRCHYFSEFSDTRPHRTGVASPDRGHYVVDPAPENDGAFRTPSLRNVELRAPYMHDGRFSTLREVVDFYDRGGDGPAGPEISKLGLSEDEKEALIAFLKSLTYAPKPSEPPQLPPPGSP